MTTLPYFKILENLPPPPQWLLDTIDPTDRPDYAAFNLDADQGHLALKDQQDWKDQNYKWLKPMVSNRNARHLFEPEATDWLLSNISKNFNTKNSGWMYFDEEQLPHTDLTREWTILYNIDTGGEDVELSFWQEPGHPVRRTTGHQTWDNCDGLTLLETIKGPFNCWYLMHTNCIHSVKNMTSTRLNLQLSFDHGTVPDVLY
jgi:hypothetical protein